MKLWQKILLTVLLGILTAIITVSAVRYSNNHAPSENMKDIIHSIIPFNYVYYLIAQIAMFIAWILFIIFIIKNKRYDSIPLFFTSLAIFYLVRSLLVFIMPLKDPYPLPRQGFIYDIIPHGGMLPSGHTGFVFMMYLFMKKNIGLVFAIVTAIFLIISRLHYTIDIIAAIIIVFAIYHFMIYIKDRNQVLSKFFNP